MLIDLLVSIKLGYILCHKFNCIYPLALMNKDDLYIARRLFQLEIYKRNGQDFENLFSKVMRLHDSAFVQVKPQGKYGDRKNDGFIKSKGIYYQVYAPEHASNREKDTIDKLVEDFDGLHNYWHQQVTPIKEFNFVLNDKYQGAYASLHAELAKIENKYNGIQCNSFLSHHLEEIFIKLPQHHIEDVIGKIPSAEEISLNVSILNEVIEHLISIKSGYSSDALPINPDFEEKLSFNSLSTPVATILRYGSYQEGVLKEYFSLNSTFTKDELKNTFNQLYQDGLKTIPESTQKNDLVFFYISENAYPVKNKVYQDSIFVLMAYFFSYCDIFEEPVKQQTLFAI